MNKTDLVFFFKILKNQIVNYHIPINYKLALSRKLVTLKNKEETENYSIQVMMEKTVL